MEVAIVQRTSVEFRKLQRMQLVDSQRNIGLDPISRSEIFQSKLMARKFY